MTSELGYFFNPRAIAVIGASREDGKIGNIIFKELVSGFSGEVFPVNPNADEILGKKCYQSVKDIHGHIDFAVIAVPAQFVPKVIKECSGKEIKAAVVISAGFGESGYDKLDKEVLKNKGKMRIIGPNCLGIFDASSGVDTLFLPEEKLKRPKKGSIAFITQSGAVGSIVLDMLASEGYGISKFISYGNALDLNEIDLLEYLGNDESTKVICMYVEGTKDGRRLIDIAKQVVKKKPVLILKAGKTAEGTVAASSHTGALAGADAVYDGAIKQAGMIRIEDVKDMFDYAGALSCQMPAKGKNILIITNGGGFGVIATDKAVEEGLNLAQFSEASKKEMKKCLPAYMNLHNPLDLGGDADAERYRIALEAAGKDKNIDAVLCITLLQTTSLGEDIIDVVTNFSNKKLKPIVACCAGGEYVQKQMLKYEERGVPVFDSPAMAAKAVWCLARYGEIRKK